MNLALCSKQNLHLLNRFNRYIFATKKGSLKEHRWPRNVVVVFVERDRANGLRKRAIWKRVYEQARRAIDSLRRRERERWTREMDERIQRDGQKTAMDGKRDTK